MPDVQRRAAGRQDRVALRLPTELRNRPQRVREALSKRAGGVELVISHVVREVIERGLDSLERELGRK